MKRLTKRMKKLIVSIELSAGASFDVPVEEKLKMFLDGRLNVKDHETGELLDPMQYEWTRTINGEYYGKLPVYCVKYENGVLERSFQPCDTLCSRQ